MNYLNDKISKVFFCVVALFYLSAHQLFAQLIQQKNYGINLGVVSALGSHFNRFGFTLQTYVVYDFAQINASFRVYENYKNLGPKLSYTEFNGGLGLCLGYGAKHTEQNLFVSSLGNQTAYQNSIAYSYQFWKNDIATSQVTGQLAFQFNKITVITENDLLAKPILDRFRTGAVLIQYQDKNIQYALNCTMWTGKMGPGVKNDSLYPAIGYLSGVGGIYSTLSHGLLSAQIKTANNYGQYLQANLGVDADQVRHVLQNKLMHDMPFVPKKLNKAQNLHIPMIDDKGEQFLFREKQKVRKPKLFLNAFTSPTLFY